MFATTEAAQGTSFDDMVAHQKQVAAIIAPGHEHRGIHVGGRRQHVDLRHRTKAVCSWACKPRDERLSVDEIIKELRPKLAKVPGIVVYMQNPPAIQIGGRVSKSLYQFTMQSSDIDDARIRRRRSSWTQMRKLDAAAGRDERSPARQSAGERRDRPRARRVARRERAADRDGALQRVRIASGLDDLHAEQRSIGW